MTAPYNSSRYPVHGSGRQPTALISIAQTLNKRLADMLAERGVLGRHGGRCEQDLDIEQCTLLWEACRAALEKCGAFVSVYDLGGQP